MFCSSVISMTPNFHTSLRGLCVNFFHFHFSIFKKINISSVTSSYCPMWYQKRENFPFTFSSITYKVRITHWICCTAEQALGVINFGAFRREKINSTISQGLNILTWNSKTLWTFSLGLLRRVHSHEKNQMENWNFMSIIPTIIILRNHFFSFSLPLS